MEKISKFVSYKIKSFFKNKIDYLIFLIILFIANLKLLFNTCSIYLPFNFDSQSLLTWQYSAYKGLLPYKDVFYPYGLLFYFKDDFFFSIISFFLFLIIFLVFFKIFKSLFCKKWLAYSSFAIFTIFVCRFISPEIFIRYGSAPAFLSLFVINQNFRSGFINWKSIIFFSIISGLLFGLLNDSGIYLFISLIFAFVVYPSLANGFFFSKDISYWKEQLKSFFLSLGGFILGFSPFLIYFAKENITYEFFLNFSQISKLFYIAKIPFTPSMLSSPNLLTISSVVLIIVFIVLRVLKLSKTEKKFLFIQISLAFLLILIEQKNVMRSTDTLISFLGFFLLIIIFSNLLNILKRRALLIYFLFIPLLLILTFTNIFSPLSIQKRVHTGFKSCIAINLQNSSTINGLLDLKDELNKANIAKVFSYPADPIIYALLEQKPPYYFSTYDASMVKKQKKTVDYIKENDIRYIIINTEIKSVQDSVPDYVRAVDLTRYIFNNYKYFKQIGKYLILEKDSNNDFFLNTLSNSFIKNYLNVNLGTIGLSEGIYKSQYLRQQPTIKENGDVSSKNRLVLIKGDKNGNYILKIKTKDKLETNISFFCKKARPCIINLDNIPLFYKNRVIVEIEAVNFNGNISIYDNEYNEKFW